MVSTPMALAPVYHCLLDASLRSCPRSVVDPASPASAPSVGLENRGDRRPTGKKANNRKRKRRLSRPGVATGKHAATKVNNVYASIGDS